MLNIPSEYKTPCVEPGEVVSLSYGKKYLLLYTPRVRADRILYLIHGGGGNQHDFFCPEFLNMVDHMIADGKLEPLYIAAPCFYDPDQRDKRPAASGVAVKAFSRELREQILPLAEARIGLPVRRENRAVGGFSMGGVATWYAFMQALDLFYWFLPLSGDCWALAEKGGGSHPAETAAELAAAVARQGAPDYRVHAITGSGDIAFPNLDAQIRAMEKYPAAFGGKLRYDVLEGGVHDYQTIFRYLYNALPQLFRREKGGAEA